MSAWSSCHRKEMMSYSFSFLVACSTVTVTKCQAALRTLQAFPFFKPTCLCRPPQVDPECNTFRDFLFDHPCVFVLKKGKWRFDKIWARSVNLFNFIRFRMEPEPKRMNELFRWDSYCLVHHYQHILVIRETYFQFQLLNLKIYSHFF